MLSTSEGEQSPPANNNLSSSEFSVFANVNIGSGNASGIYKSFSRHEYVFKYVFSAYFASQTTLNTTVMSDDTISITSTVPSSMAPEIPRRSNSIISMTSHNSFNNFDHHKPLLSPRVRQPHHQTTVSPKVLDALSEDARSMEFQPTDPRSDPISPSICNKNNSYRASARNMNITSNDIIERSSPSYNPSSPRYAPELNNTNGPLPISPHVNVPNAHSFNPPPLPPRVRKKKEFSHSQLRQAKDAPLLLPRDKSPPPLPPRTGHSSVSSHNNNVEAFNHLVSGIIG